MTRWRPGSCRGLGGGTGTRGGGHRPSDGRSERPGAACRAEALLGAARSSGGAVDRLPWSWAAPRALVSAQADATGMTAGPQREDDGPARSRDAPQRPPRCRAGLRNVTPVRAPLPPRHMPRGPARCKVTLPCTVRPDVSRPAVPPPVASWPAAPDDPVSLALWWIGHGAGCVRRAPISAWLLSREAPSVSRGLGRHAIVATAGAPATGRSRPRDNAVGIAPWLGPAAARAFGPVPRRVPVTAGPRWPGAVPVARSDCVFGER